MLFNGIVGNRYIILKISIANMFSIKYWNLYTATLEMKYSRIIEVQE